MMNSGFGNNNNNDDDFGPNPFRSNVVGTTGSIIPTSNNGSNNMYPTPQGGGGDFIQQQQQQQQQYSPQNQFQQQQQQPNQQQFQQPQMQMQQSQQPNQQAFYQPTDQFNPAINNNMNMGIPMQQQQQQQQQPQFMSGMMDQNATSVPGMNGVNNYGTTGATTNFTNTPLSIFSWRGLVSCMRLDTYTLYFDVDTIDIVDRLKGSVTKFIEPDVFRTTVLGDITVYDINNNQGSVPNAATVVPSSPTATATATATTTTPASGDGIMRTLKKGPDLYGPLWISMTLIFILGATSNLSSYLHHQRHVRSAADDEKIDDFEYDITHLIRAGSIIVTFCYIVPTIYWIVTHCLGIPAISWAMWLCCYGYSSVPIMIGALTAWWFPYNIWHWLVLAFATFCSGMLVVRNLSTPLLQQDTAMSAHAKAAPMILAILGTHFVYMCVLKFSFFTHKY